MLILSISADLEIQMSPLNLFVFHRKLNKFKIIFFKGLFF